MQNKLVPLTAYQGGKQRIAATICDAMRVGPDDTFYDLCCGSGAVAIEMVNRGHRPDCIHMLDRGGWCGGWWVWGSSTWGGLRHCAARYRRTSRW